MDINQIIKNTEEKILEAARQAKSSGSVSADIDAHQTDLLTAVYKNEEQTKMTILQEQAHPTKNQPTAGIIIKVPDPEKLAKGENTLSQLSKERESIIARSSALLKTFNKGTKLIKSQRKKIKKIEKYLTKLNLPYMAIIPYPLLEKIVKDFNFFHFRNSDFSIDGRLLIPESKVNIKWEKNKMIIDKKMVANGYQGMISKCLFAKNCDHCHKICKMRKNKIVVDVIPENYDFTHGSNKIIKYYISKNDEWVSYKLWAVKIFLPKPGEEIQKKIRSWIAKCAPDHIFTIADQKAVDVEPVTVKCDPIIGYNLGKIKKRYQGYAALIDQYGDFVEEKQATRLLVAYYQTILGEGIDLGAAIN